MSHVPTPRGSPIPTTAAGTRCGSCLAPAWSASGVGMGKCGMLAERVEMAVAVACAADCVAVSGPL
jgi:hypothetical protein